MARGEIMSTAEGSLSNAPGTNNLTAENEALAHHGHEQMLDPSTSERRYWRDPLSAIQREIWRPGMFPRRRYACAHTNRPTGDGDGDVEHDHHERSGPVAPLEQRWRLYQSPGPFKARITEPPSNVILDDRAVYEILQSNIPRAQLPKRWSHDFSGQASVRHRRPHRGRPAYKNEQAASDNDKYHSFKPNGRAAGLYFFSGEKDYEPVYYHDLPPAPEESPEPDDEDSDTPVKPKQHNQYTAPELLVRNGAESKSLTKGKYRPRVNTFLRRSPSPSWVKDRKRLFGGVGIGRNNTSTPASGAPPSTFDFSFAQAPVATGAPSGGESMWVEQDDEKEVMDIDDDDDEVLPSVFDLPAAGGGNKTASSNEGGIRAQSTPVASPKRQAPSQLVAARPKAPRQMGYIERLAAGLLQEEEGVPAASLLLTTAGTTSAGDEDRITQLEDDLDAAYDALNDKNREIAELRLELEELQTQLASRYSVDDD